MDSLQSEIDELKSEILRLKQEVKKRDGVISSLKSDIEGLKKEIQERDDTIQDKVNSYNQFYPQTFYQSINWSIDPFYNSSSHFITH